MLFLIIVQINGVNQIDEFLNSSSGKGTCDDDMSCAGVMKEKFRLFGGNVVGIRFGDDSDDRFRKAHGKHLGKAANIVSAVVAETDDIRVISRGYCGAAAEKRSIRIFAGGIDSVGPGFDGLGFVVSHIKVMKAADKGGFSAAGTPDQNYFSGFDFLCKTERAVIFFPVLRVNKSDVYGIFFRQNLTSAKIFDMALFYPLLLFFSIDFCQKGFMPKGIYAINKM